MSNVVSLPIGSVGDGVRVEPDDVLSAAIGNARSVVVVFEDNAGELRVSSSDGAPEALMLMERAKKRLVASYED